MWPATGGRGCLSGDRGYALLTVKNTRTTPLGVFVEEPVRPRYSHGPAAASACSRRERRETRRRELDRRRGRSNARGDRPGRLAFGGQGASGSHRGHSSSHRHSVLQSSVQQGSVWRLSQQATFQRLPYRRGRHDRRRCGVARARGDTYGRPGGRSARRSTRGTTCRRRHRAQRAALPAAGPSPSSSSSRWTAASRVTVATWRAAGRNRPSTPISMEPGGATHLVAWPWRQAIQGTQPRSSQAIRAQSAPSPLPRARRST